MEEAQAVHIKKLHAPDIPFVETGSVYEPFACSQVTCKMFFGI